MLAALLHKFSRGIAKSNRLIQRVGLLPALRLGGTYLQLRLHRPKSDCGLHFDEQALHPLWWRYHSSDHDVFNQIFLFREYRCLDQVVDPGLIIDCGANVGYSSAYFLSRFPQAIVIAVEPDPDNFAVLQANLAPYKGRCRAIHSGIWSDSVGLVVAEEPFGDGREWSRQVRPAKPDETPTIIAIDIGILLEESGFERISILKVDIEGAEAIVFASNYQEWLHKVDNLVIELHGSECESIFFNAIAQENFVVDRCDELTVCTRSLAVPARVEAA